MLFCLLTGITKSTLFRRVDARRGGLEVRRMELEPGFATVGSCPVADVEDASELRLAMELVRTGAAADGGKGAAVAAATEGGCMAPGTCGSTLVVVAPLISSGFSLVENDTALTRSLGDASGAAASGPASAASRASRASSLLLQLSASLLLLLLAVVKLPIFFSSSGGSSSWMLRCGPLDAMVVDLWKAALTSMLCCSSCLLRNELSFFSEPPGVCGVLGLPGFSQGWPRAWSMVSRALGST